MVQGHSKKEECIVEQILEELAYDIEQNDYEDGRVFLSTEDAKILYNYLTELFNLLPR